MNYLAIDFGTSNCVAGRLTLRDGQYKLDTVPLDSGGSKQLPSVVFVRGKNLPSLDINTSDFERRVRDAVHSEQLRIQREEKEFDSRVATFIKLNRPKVRRPNPIDYSSNNESFRRALKQYERDLEAAPIALADFLTRDVDEYKRQLKKFFRPPFSEEEIRHRIRSQMERSSHEDRAKELWDKTFFNAINDPSMETLYGVDAMSAYSMDSLSGFFMRSPKAFLAVASGPHIDIFTKIVSRLVRYIRRSAEEYFGEVFDGVVFGRPVNFLGSSVAGEAGNKNALSIMKNAAHEAGFTAINFVLEPLAASLALRRVTLDTSDPILMIDLGGGTTDVAYLEVDPAGEVNFNVVSAVGERYGGNDLDEAIAKGVVSPELGRGALTESGSLLPMSILSNALETRNIHSQVAFRRGASEIEKLLELVRDSDRIRVERLKELYLNQLQHQVILSSEKMKSGLSGDELVSEAFDFFENPFTVEIGQESYREVVSRELEKITEVVRRCCAEVNLGDRPIRVFFTGGVSQDKTVVNSIVEILPAGSTVAFMPPLISVVGGLAVIARQLSLSESETFQPAFVRGIPVERG